MPPMNGPREECGCCVDCEECECSNGEICDCICGHEIGGHEEASSSPPPPPPLQPPPAQAPNQPRAGQPRPQPRDMSPRRSRTRSRSRSPSPSARSRRRSRERSREGSVAEAARYVAKRVWNRAKRDRREMEEQWESQARKVVAQFKIGHKEGITCAQRLHNSYVTPEDLSRTFMTGFLACMAGILIGLIIMMLTPESF